MAANTAPNINGSDPSILQQIQRQTGAALAKPVSNPTVIGGTTTPNVATGTIRALAPVISGQDVIYPQSTTTTSSNAVTINSSINNDTVDVTTVYSTGGRITVNPINQTINQYTSVDSGVSQILAGNNVTITSTGNSGTGVVTINATGGGNYTLPTASPSVLGGVKVGSGLSIDGSGILSATGGGGGFAVEYEIGTFVANTVTGFGEIQFADNEGSNSAPATAQKLFISEGALNEQSMGTILQQWTSNSYRGTLSLNNGVDQATFNISNGGLYFDPEEYRGFYAGLNQVWGDDCSINQLIITNSPSVQYYNTDFLVEDDVFHAKSLGGGNTHVMLNVYGSSEFEPINPQYLWNLFVSFVDNVLYDGGSTLTTDVNQIRAQFYNNNGSFRGTIPPQDYYQWFDFASSTEYFSSAPVTGGLGTSATLRVRLDPTDVYTVLGVSTAGSGYSPGDTLVVLGTDLGGASPTNDLTVTVNSVDGTGGITEVAPVTGVAVYPWPTNYISDGSDDQYDSGNYINTNLDTEISYANGIAQTSVAAFGNGDYAVMYNESIFCMVTTNASIDELFYSGNLGSDGDGWVRWTGLRSSQAVTPNNQVRYAYFDSEYLDGELTPTVGVTYNMNLDSAGINLDEYYAYFNNNNNDYYFGSNNTWRLESQEQLYVQSYNDMYIQTMTPQRGPGLSGPNIIINPADGTDAVAEINAPAQQGGSVNITGGDGGYDDEVPVLGASGGSVNITGGIGTGNSQAGNVNLYGGEGANSGSINLYTDFGSNSSGKVTINTYDGNTNKTWEFRPDGSTIYPTLSVTRGDRSGTLTGQTLLFGDSTQEAIITTPNGTSDINSSQRFVINPGAGYTGTTGEGGDIYLYAGRGGDAGGSGGDIKIRGGLGPVDGAGGYLDIQGGDTQGNGPGGYVEIRGGESQNNIGGEIRLIGGLGGGTTGGNANITGGYGATHGGNINIIGGQAGTGLGDYGNIYIGSGTATWAFDNTGNTYVPNDGYVRTYNGTGGAAGGNLSITAGAADQAIYNSNAGGNLNLIGGLGGSNDGGGGGQGGNVNITSGASADVAGHNGNVKINTGGSNSWTFDYNGVLNVPGEGIINSINDTVTLQSSNTVSGGANSVYLGTSGGLGFFDTAIPGNWLEIFRNGTNPQLATTGNLLICTDSTNTAPTWTFGNDGNLTVPGWIDGQITTFTGAIAGNVLTVTNAVDGTIARGQTVYGNTVAANTVITSQLTQTSGAAGGNGTYRVSGTQTVASEAMNVNSLYLDGDIKLAADHGIYVRDVSDPYEYDNLIGIAEVDATILIGSLNTNGVTLDNDKEYKVDSALNPGTYMAVAKVNANDEVILSSGNSANTLIRVGGDSATTGYGMKLVNGGEALIPVGLRIGDNTNASIFGAPLEVGSILGAAANNQSVPGGIALPTYRGTGTVIANDEWGSYIYGARYRGTINSPLPVKDGDWLMEFGATAFDGTNNNGGGEIALRVDGTVTGSSNPSKIEFYNTLSGANSQSLGMVLDSTQKLSVSGPVKTVATTIALLGSAATAGVGARAFATDGNLVAAGNFGAVVGGSGANAVPVYSDGTDWRIG